MKHEENGQLPKKNCEECIVSQKQLVAKLSQVAIEHCYVQHFRWETYWLVKWEIKHDTSHLHFGPVLLKTMRVQRKKRQIEFCLLMVSKYQINQRFLKRAHKVQEPARKYRRKTQRAAYAGIPLLSKNHRIIALEEAIYAFRQYSCPGYNIYAQWKC